VIRLARRGALTGLLGLAAPGCRRPPPAPSGPPRRLISLSPSTTEALFFLGAGPWVVGRSRYCDFPPEAARVPQVGGYVDPNLEVILGLTPDLVTGEQGPAGPAIARKLEAHQIRTYFPPTASFAQIDAMLLGFDDLLGLGGAARPRVEKIQADRLRITRAVEGLPRPRVLLIFGFSPTVAAGPGGFPDEMIRLAGGQNAIDEARSRVAYPQLSLEQVLAIDPDLILDATAMGGGDATGPGSSWSGVRAVREKKLFVLRGEAVLRPGPRVAEGAAELAHAIHPGLAL
jgi:iron complex transport system substrate-binding protein